ncbi:MAG TPA: GNAT family N-acetyltransferase [Solirubrobacteraceae bacterium]|jgi:GNAT superfamily N-acetyltransferase
MSVIEIPSNISRRFAAGLIVRGAVADDLPDVLALLSQLHDEDVLDLADEDLTSTFAVILASRTRAIFVALREGAIVGTLDLFVVANLTRGGRPWAGIENLVVDVTCRRQGVGRALVTVAADIARGVGCYKLQLVSHEERNAAHALYSHIGFTGPVRGYRRYLDGESGARL